MAKYTAPISEDIRQRILALPRGVKFPAFMERAITLFVEELEKDPELTPEDFMLARTERKATPRQGKNDSQRIITPYMNPNRYVILIDNDRIGSCSPALLLKTLL